MKKALVITMLSLVLCVPAFSQDSIAKSINYEERFVEANAAYSKNPESVSALFNMTMFYLDNANPMQNLPTAMRFANKTEHNYIDLMMKEDRKELTRLLRGGISLAVVRELREAVREAAYITLSQRNDLSSVEIDEYMAEFKDDPDIIPLLRQCRIEQVYNKDLDIATPQSYYHTIITYPGTDKATAMEERMADVAAQLFEGIDNEAGIDSIAEAYKDSPSVQRTAARHKSRMAYSRATATNTVAAYKDFLRKFPSSDENLQARERLESLLAVEYGTLKTARQYADFIDSNADNSMADKAMHQLRSMIEDNHDIEAARLYIERYQYDPQYNNIYSRYYSWYAESGNGDLLRRFEEENPDFPFMNALERDIERAEILDQIFLLEPFKEEDRVFYGMHIKQASGKKLAFVPLQRMLQELLAKGDYKTALSRVEQYESYFDNVSHDEYLELKTILSAPAKKVKKTHLYHTKTDIVNPIINPSDGHLYYTRTEGSSHRIYYATNNNGRWTEAGTLNFSNDSNISLTIFGFYDNGQKMIMGNKGDIWIAELDNDGWRVSDIPPYPVNSDFIETDAFMLADGSGILLASDRPGGQNLQKSGAYYYGDTALATDIYFIPHINGSWGTPVNLGVNINSPFCERSPIISSDLKTLYFITDGHGGLGFGDIYSATRNDVEDWTSWSQPKNLGREVNTGFKEASLSFTPNEKEIIVSSNATNQRYEVYLFPIEHTSTSPYTNYTLDVQGMEDYLFRIRVADLSQQSVIQVMEYSGQGSSIDINIHKGKRYAILGDAGIYFIPAIIINPGNNTQRLNGYTYSTLVALDRAVPLAAVTFERASAKLEALANLQLEQLAQFLTQNPSAVIELDIDVAGPEDALAYNLSLERGRTLQNRLAEHGIDNRRIVISAYGNARNNGDCVAVQFR